MIILHDNDVYNITKLYTNHTVMVAGDGSRRPAFFGEWLAGHCPLLLEDIIKKCSGSLLTSFRCSGTLIPLEALSNAELKVLAASNRTVNESIMVFGGDPSPESFRQLRRLYEFKALDLEESVMKTR
jgi:hypothetical protein